jgi:hypothetical protein
VSSAERSGKEARSKEKSEPEASGMYNGERDVLVYATPIEWVFRVAFFCNFKAPGFCSLRRFCREERRSERVVVEDSSVLGLK